MNENLKINQKGLQLIKDSEGFSEDAYLCPAGVPTIGYGTTVYSNGNKVKLGDKITEKQATEELLYEIETCERRIKDYLKVQLNNNQFSAIVSFSYNLGTNAFKNSTMLKLINKKRFDEAADEFPRWNKAAGRILPGLVKRRAKERELFLG